MLIQKGQSLCRQMGEVFVLSNVGQRPLDGENGEESDKRVFGASYGRKELAFDRLLFVGSTIMLQCDSARHKQSVPGLPKIR